MYDNGFTNLVNIDISSVVIHQMRERSAKSRPHLCYQVADCTEMPEFADNSFDVVIDKSTIDAILCGESSFVNTAKMLKEI